MKSKKFQKRNLWRHVISCRFFFYLESQIQKRYTGEMSENTKESQENIKIKQLPNSEIEIEGEISADVFESYYRKANPSA